MNDDIVLVCIGRAAAVNNVPVRCHNNFWCVGMILDARISKIKVGYMNAPLCAGLSSLRKTGWAAALHSA
ncbi:hypothetical protein, partial [Burkholderia vietnamiensis]